MKGINALNNLRPNNLVADLVKLIEKELIFFTQSQEFINTLVKKKNENQHTLAFCNYFSSKCNAKFNFEREVAQKGSFTVDVGVFKNGVLFFTIEAKLLPIPNKKSERKEYEYVYGKGAGIQRFKDGKHGVDNEDKLLLESGLIAFIKEQNIDYWYEKVNQWILDAEWNASEQLQKTNLNYKFISNHLRENAPNIKLHHFWVKVF